VRPLSHDRHADRHGADVRNIPTVQARPSWPAHCLRPSTGDHRHLFCFRSPTSCTQAGGRGNQRTSSSTHSDDPGSKPYAGARNAARLSAEKHRHASRTKRPSRSRLDADRWPRKIATYGVTLVRNLRDLMALLVAFFVMLVAFSPGSGQAASRRRSMPMPSACRQGPLFRRHRSAGSATRPKLKNVAQIDLRSLRNPTPTKKTPAFLRREIQGDRKFASPRSLRKLAGMRRSPKPRSTSCRETKQAHIEIVDQDAARCLRRAKERLSVPQDNPEDRAAQAMPYAYPSPATPQRAKCRPSRYGVELSPTRQCGAEILAARAAERNIFMVPASRHDRCFRTILDVANRR